MLSSRSSMLGLVGGPMLIIVFVGIVFGAFEAGSSAQFLLSAPEMVWEASLGIYLTLKGFRSALIISLEGSWTGSRTQYGHGLSKETATFSPSRSFRRVMTARSAL